jgi:hypothetical protein
MENDIKEPLAEQFPVSEALDKLQHIADILRGMGLTVIDRFITVDLLAAGLPFPIVTDGVNGIRAQYSKR